MKLHCTHIIAATFTIFAIAAALVALFVDKLSIFLDQDDDTYAYGGWYYFEFEQYDCYDTVTIETWDETIWNGTESEDVDVACLPKQLEYEHECDDDDWCDTQNAGLFWFWSLIASCVFLSLNFVLILVKKPVLGCLFGFIACLGFILAICVWVGLDTNFDFKGNPICFDKQSDELPTDGSITPGDSVYILIGSIVFAFIAWFLSCVGARTDHFSTHYDV